MSDHLTNAKILYIADDPVLRQLVPLILEQKNFKVRTASNGQKGLKMALEWLPDLILMDLMMPIVNGFQATKALRVDPRTRQIPIVAFSALTNPNLQAKAQEVGINGLIPKPTSLADLISTPETYLVKKER